MTARKPPQKKNTTTRRTLSPKLDHPGQAIDTPLPDDSVDEEAFDALRQAYEEKPDKDEVPVDPEVS